jgi:hypothetical protein
VSFRWRTKSRRRRPRRSSTTRPPPRRLRAVCRTPGPLTPIGGTRRDWRGQDFFRALTEQQEAWAIEQGFDEIVVKTKNKFYDYAARSITSASVVTRRNPADNAESKVYLSKSSCRR